MPVKKEEYSIADVYYGVLDGEEWAWEVVQKWVTEIVYRIKFRPKGYENEDCVQLILGHLLEKIKSDSLELDSPDAFKGFLSFPFSRNTLIDVTRRGEYHTWERTIPIENNDKDSDGKKPNIEIEAPSSNPDSKIDASKKLGYMIECLEYESMENRRLFRLKAKEEAGIISDAEKSELAAINNAAVKFTRLKKKLEKCIEIKLTYPGKQRDNISSY
jgi:hypothetical protein